MENRLKLIYNAGSNLFINKGYSLTQMRDIAKEIGLSVGMLYQYFAGKKDILNFILKCTIEPSFLEQEFEYPVKSELFNDVGDLVNKTFSATQEQFGQHLKDNAANYELKDMLSDAFDIIAKYGVALLIIEHNEDSLDEYKYYRQFRHVFLEQVLAYIKIYIANGTFRKVPDDFYVARAIVEILAWWGMHIMYDAFERDPNITYEKSKALCFDLLLSAYSV